MTSEYTSLVNNLRIELKNKNIKFNTIFKLINNEKYDDIKQIIKDEKIETLIENVVNERIKIGQDIEEKLNNLIWLNESLNLFGEEPQTSKTKALKILKTIYINIYDLVSEQYEKKTTRELLKKDLRKNPDRRFIKSIAKGNITLKCFLIKI